MTARTSRLPSAAVAALALAGFGAAEAGPLDRYLERIAEALDAASAARAPVPPVAVPVAWKARALGAIDLGAPLLALESGDLDGDGREELVALTTGEVVVLAVGGKGVSAATRAALPGDPALVRSRDPVGTLVIDGPSITARSSEQATGARFHLKEGKLAQVADKIAGFPLCPALTAELEPGRNTFDPATARWSVDPAPVAIGDEFFAVECRRHIGADGRPLKTVAISGINRVVDVSCRKPDSDDGCPADALGASEIDASGYAFEVADVDRDGRLEVITSRGQAPGRNDRVRAFAPGDDKAREVFDRRFDGGVVALSAPDLDGDGAREVIAAVRPWRETRIELWVLTRPR